MDYNILCKDVGLTCIIVAYKQPTFKVNKLYSRVVKLRKLHIKKFFTLHSTVDLDFQLFCGLNE